LPDADRLAFVWISFCAVVIFVTVVLRTPGVKKLSCRISLAQRKRACGDVAWAFKHVSKLSAFSFAATNAIAVTSFFIDGSEQDQ
jgi:hypothetical protein